MKGIIFFGVGFFLLASVGFFGWKYFHSENSKAFENGDMIPEIKLRDISGDTLSLSSLRGNIVLLQFWASWCSPCRIENRELVVLYSKYKNTNMIDGGSFKIFSVSLDEDTAAWKQAILNDELNWKEHMNYLNDKNGVLKKFELQSIPTSYLIDQKGMIIGVDLSALAIENILKKRMK